ncbi:MAG: hypothetical protein GWO02_00630 [Gammaproteobacteria bacterium]|nr:hypothetical protein [Gammaproteobacteria bacterium]
MPYCYPEPWDVGIRVPPYLFEDRFRSGFRHALEGGNITRREHLRLSFREGFRAGKLYLRRLRRARGVVEFPMRGKVKMRVG